MIIDEKALYRFIGRQIKARRQILKLTQQWLADQADLERTSITNIEAGSQKLSLHTMYRICQALEMEMTDLLPTVDTVSVEEMQDVDVNGHRTSLPAKTANLVRELLDDLDEE